jgi:hypothetical protein
MLQSYFAILGSEPVTTLHADELTCARAKDVDRNEW